jgi:hypothetical protein
MKGQYFSFDVLFATFVFLLVFSYFLIQWNNLFTQPKRNLFEDGYHLSSLLFSTNPYFGILFDEDSKELNDYFLQHPNELRAKIYNLLAGTPYNMKIVINSTVYWNGCFNFGSQITFNRVGLLKGHPVPVEIVVCPKS